MANAINAMLCVNMYRLGWSGTGKCFRNAKYDWHYSLSSTHALKEFAHRIYHLADLIIICTFHPRVQNLVCNSRTHDIHNTLRPLACLFFPMCVTCEKSFRNLNPFCDNDQRVAAVYLTTLQTLSEGRGRGHSSLILCHWRRIMGQFFEVGHGIILPRPS